MANQTALGVSSNNILTPGYPIVGGDTPGTNLTIRSTSHPTKGAVVIDEYTASYGSNSGSFQTLGGIGAQHNVSVGGALYNMPYGYSVTNIIAPQAGGGFYPGFSYIVPITATSITGTTATITYTTQAANPFNAGDTIVITGNGGGYNGTFTVASVSSSQITVTPSFGSGNSATGFVYATKWAGPTQPTISIGLPVLTGGAPAQALPVMNAINLQTTATAGTGSVATLTFGAQTYPPYYVGQLINVTSVTPTGYNGIYTVTACTTTTVSYASATTGSQTAVGVISAAGVTSATITNPGTGYLAPPQVIFSDPSPAVAQLYTANLTVAAGQYVKVIQTPATPTTNILYYYVQVGGVMSGTGPTATQGFITNGAATLVFVGAVAQGYTALGYSGIITQGAIHQMGCVVSGVIVSQGSNYTSPPVVTFSRPDMPGGRFPQATVTVSGGAITGFLVEDQGSGYLNPPIVTLTNVGTNTAGSGGIITAVIGNPGEKPLVSTMPTPYNSNYYIDFGLSGHNVVFITHSATTANIYFDSQGSGAAPYLHGFPQGRRVIVYFKNIGGAACTVTFQNLASANSSSGGNTASVTNGRTGKFEFIVLTTSNLQSNLPSAPGGTANDVFVTITSS